MMHAALERSVVAVHGLRRNRFYILHNIYNNPEITISQLSKATVIDVGNVSRMVRAFDGEGLVYRESKDGNRRTFYLSLTEKGIDLYKKVNADLQEELKHLLKDVDDAELMQFIDVLHKLYTLFRISYDSRQLDSD